MKFSTRLTLSAIVPAALFAAAVLASLLALLRTQSDFDTLLKREQTLVSSTTEMYAQGLQMGQALRNIVLDPAKQTAYDNFKNAAEGYDKAYELAKAVAEGTSQAADIQSLAALRAAQQQAQAQVMALARSDQAAAIQLLNAQETPAWRALRAKLIEEGKEAQEMLASSHAATVAAANRSRTLALGLAALAALVAAAFLVVSHRTVRRELGCEPAAAADVLRRIASGDLSQDIGAAAHPRSLLAELARMQEALRALVGRVRHSSEGILVASSEVAAGSQDLSSRTEQAASNLQETAASMEQITSSVQQSASSASTANELASTAAGDAQRGGLVVQDVVRAMEEISERSRRIGDIIGVIDGIAFQTNILALNAAVEAARAGEQGRGFAVVASEVRALAQRSAEAAREIKSLIGASVERVEAGSQLVVNAGQTMQQIVHGVQRVNDMIGAITAAATEQSSGVSQIGTAVADLDRMTQQNAALVEESSAAAESLKQQATELSALVGTFRLPTARLAVAA